MEHKQQTIETGKRFSTRNLMAQAAYTSELITNDLHSFMEYGFSDGFFTDFKQLQENVAVLEGKQESAKGNIPVSTNDLAKQLKATRQWVQKAQLKAKRGLRYENEKLKEFNFNSVQWNSVPRVMEIVPKFIELHEKYDTELREHGGGVPFAEDGKNILQQLNNMDGRQEKTKKDLPATTRELYLQRGLLYNSICDINAMATEVFMQDPAKIAQYNINILKRGGGKRKADGPDEPGADEQPVESVE